MTQRVGVDQIYLRSGELGWVIASNLSGAPGLDAEREIDEIFLSLLDGLPVGRPFSFREQHGGALVQEVRPAENHESEVSSRGRVELDLHTDDVFLEPSVRPQYIALLGIHNPERVPTYLVYLDDVVDYLEPKTLEVLSQPFFSFACPPSFDIDKSLDLRTNPRPILRRGARGEFEAGIDASEHLRLFKSAIEAAPRTEWTLGPGEVLVFSNSRCLHGRPPVESADRWLKRVYLRDDLSTLEMAAATDTRNTYDAVKAFRYGHLESRPAQPH